MSCGVGHRHGLDPVLLWLWRRPSSCSSDLTPSLGTSLCCRCGPKKQNKTKITQYLSFCIWLVLLSMMFSGFLFLGLIFYCMYTLHIVYSFISQWMSWRFPLCFLLRILEFWLSTLRSLIHFEIYLIFASDVWEESSFILLHMDTQFSWYHLLKSLFFPHWMVLTLLAKMWVYTRVYFWALILSRWCMCVFMPALHCFYYCRFVISFEIRKCESSNFVLLF